MGNRKHERRDVSATVRLAFGSPSESEMVGQLRNISEGGVGLELEAESSEVIKHLNENNPSGILTVVMPDGSSEKTVEIETVWARDDMGSSPLRPRMGARFLAEVESDSRVKELIDRLASQQKPFFD